MNNEIIISMNYGRNIDVNLDVIKDVLNKNENKWMSFNNGICYSSKYYDVIINNNGQIDMYIEKEEYFEKAGLDLINKFLPKLSIYLFKEEKFYLIKVFWENNFETDITDKLVIGTIYKLSTHIAQIQTKKLIIPGSYCTSFVSQVPFDDGINQSSVIC